MNFPDVIYGMTRGGPAKSTEILSTYMINIVYYENNYSKASAVGVIVILLLLVYTILYLRFSGQGEMEL
jgi:multiple sugar transport system permease protein